MTPHSSSIAFLSSTSSSTVIFPSESRTLFTSVAMSLLLLLFLLFGLVVASVFRGVGLGCRRIRRCVGLRDRLVRRRALIRTGLGLGGSPDSSSPAGSSSAGRLFDRCFRGGLDDLALLLELLDAGVDEPVQVAQRRRHEREQLRERRDDRADELRRAARRRAAASRAGRPRRPRASCPRACPPRSVSTFVSFAVAASAFATAAGSPDDSMNAIAVGPSSITSSASAPACSAARRVSVFLTMRKRAPCGMSWSRSASSCLFVRPR